HRKGQGRPASLDRYCAAGEVIFLYRRCGVRPYSGRMGGGAGSLSLAGRPPTPTLSPLCVPWVEGDPALAISHALTGMTDRLCNPLQPKVNLTRNVSRHSNRRAAKLLAIRAHGRSSKRPVRICHPSRQPVVAPPLLRPARRNRFAGSR